MEGNYITELNVLLWANQSTNITLSSKQDCGAASFRLSAPDTKREGDQNHFVSGSGTFFIIGLFEYNLMAMYDLQEPGSNAPGSFWRNFLFL